jgi:hypothetical protein
MVLTLSQGLVVSSSIGFCVLLMTSVNAMIHSCIKGRINETCSFEPTASALGIGQGNQAIQPPVTRSRPPTLYVPRKPMPKHLERMPETDEEKAMADEFAWLARVAMAPNRDSDESRDTFDVEKQEILPLNPRKSQPLNPRTSQPLNSRISKPLDPRMTSQPPSTRQSQPLHPRRSQRVKPVRPARPWSEAPQPRNPGSHAI